MAGVLERQSREPLCGKCISYALTVKEAREALRDLTETLSSDNDAASEFRSVLKEASATILGVPVPKDPQRQRKTGQCRLPDKACFIKRARMLFLFFKEKHQSRN